MREREDGYHSISHMGRNGSKFTRQGRSRDAALTDPGLQLVFQQFPHYSRVQDPLISCLHLPKPLWSVLSLYYGSEVTQVFKENHSPKLKSKLFKDLKSALISVLLFLYTRFPNALQSERTHLKRYTSCKNVQYNDSLFQDIICFSESLTGFGYFVFLLRCQLNS